MKTLNSKLESHSVPVRTESRSFSSDKDHTAGDGIGGKESVASLSTSNKEELSLASTISTDKEFEKRETIDDKRDEDRECKDGKGHKRDKSERGTQPVKVVRADLLDRMTSSVKSIINYILL